MCRIEEKVYTNKLGQKNTYENYSLCARSSQNQPCANVTRHRAGYVPKSGGFSDSASSIGPPSPASPSGSGTYLVETRRPSSSSGRPSTRDGIQSVKPEIVIQFGGSKNKKGPSIHISTQKPRTTSSESSVVYSDSDGSHTMRTGFVDEPHMPSFASGSHLPTPRHGRTTSSGSSFTTSSGTPSHVSSDFDYDSPRGHAGSNYSRPVVHNPSSTGASYGLGVSPPSPYRTHIISPASSSKERQSLDGFRSDQSTSSHGSSRPSKDADRHRKRREDERKFQYEDEDEDENAKQVRFQLGRDEMRAQLREDNLQAESDRRRAEERRRLPEERRQTKDREPERESRHKSKQPATEPRRQSRSRRPSLSGAQRPSKSDEEERRRLRTAELEAMKHERRNVAALEKEEKLYNLSLEQQNPDYYNTRSNLPPALTRRGSVSTSAPPPLERPGSRQSANVSQPLMPSVTRPEGTQRQRGGPPVSFYNTGRPEHPGRRPSSSHQDRPNNLFAPTTSQAPIPPPADAWNTSTMHNALPSARYPTDGYYNAQQADAHARAQQASGNMNRAFYNNGTYPPQ